MAFFLAMRKESVRCPDPRAAVDPACSWEKRSSAPFTPCGFRLHSGDDCDARSPPDPLPVVCAKLHAPRIPTDLVPRARLVRGGIYGIVRHPLYTSVILLSFAWALWWCSLPGVALALVTTVFLDAKARREEDRLCLRFLDYQAYAKRVK